MFPGHSDNTIAEMEANYEGYNNTVRMLMQRSQSGIIGTVSDIIEVPSEYVTAVETALGGALQHIVCEDDDAATKAISWLKSSKSGRATFLPVKSVRADRLGLDGSVKSAKGFIGIASEMVSCDKKYDVIMVDAYQDITIPFQMSSVEGESLFSYKGEPLPYMPFCYKHPDYWHVIKKETKRTGDMINSRKLFDDSEKAHPITEDEMIKIEKIHGTLLLIGAEDDVLWDTAKYIRRMKQRMKEHPHTCRLEYVIYEHGTHFVFPDSMLKIMLPVGSGLFVKLAFQAARKYPEECRRARLDIDQRVRNAVAKWKRVDR